MAKKQFSSAKIRRFDVNFATTPITAGSNIDLGALPANVVIIDGWCVIKTELGDADAGDDTTLSIGYTGAATAFYAATAITNMNASVYLKLLPGVLNIVAAEVITTVDTPAEIVGVARASGDPYGALVLAAEKKVLLTAGAGQDINDGTLTLFIEYLEF